MKAAERDLVEISDLATDTIEEILDRAQAMRSISGPLWQDEVRHVGLIFTEPSTRTVFSFKVACDRLGVHVLELQGTESSSIVKGETLSDTARTLEALGAGVIVVRDRDESTARQLSQKCEAGIINAGGGTLAHPSQGLIDVLTLVDEFGQLQGRCIGIVGDILHSRVARSDVIAFRAMGAKVILIAPPHLQDDSLQATGVTLESDLDAVIPQLDAIQMLRVQKERMDVGQLGDVQDYIDAYQLNPDRLNRALETMIVMHPGPMNRGVEISSEVADGARSRIFDQVAAGVPIRMALLERAFGKVE